MEDHTERGKTAFILESEKLSIGATRVDDNQFS